MTADNGPDFHLAPDGWEPADVLAGHPDGFVDELLKAEGWEGFLRIGDPNGDLYMEAWRRHHADKPTEYLLQVGDMSESGPFMVVDSFPELMDLFTRWAPAVQAASIAGAIRDLTSTELSPYGMVEMVAARTRHGLGPVHQDLVQQKQAAEARAREKARAKKAAAGNGPAPIRPSWPEPTS